MYAYLNTYPTCRVSIQHSLRLCGSATSMPYGSRPPDLGVNWACYCLLRPTPICSRFINSKKPRPFISLVDHIPFRLEGCHFLFPQCCLLAPSALHAWQCRFSPIHTLHQPSQFETETIQNKDQPLVCCPPWICCLFYTWHPATIGLPSTVPLFHCSNSTRDQGQPLVRDGASCRALVMTLYCPRQLKTP